VLANFISTTKFIGIDVLRFQAEKIAMANSNTSAAAAAAATTATATTIGFCLTDSFFPAITPGLAVSPGGFPQKRNIGDFRCEIFLQAGCPSCHPANGGKALTGNRRYVVDIFSLEFSTMFDINPQMPPFGQTIFQRSKFSAYVSTSESKSTLLTFI